jgi:enediyne polyketide synthase
LRIVHGAAPPGPVDTAWSPALLAPYLERRLGELLPESHIAVLLGAGGSCNGIAHRPDGKPLAPNGHVSRSHAGSLTLTVKASCSVGCDCEPVASRTAAVWRDLLGPEGYSLAGLLAREAREEFDRSCTRVWCALESVRKAGGRRDSAIVLSTAEQSAGQFAGWVALGAGSARIFTLVALVSGSPGPLAFAVMVDS